MENMDLMLILHPHVYGMRERNFEVRARKISNKAPGSRLSNRIDVNNGVKNDFRSFFTLLRGRGVNV